MLMKGCQSQMSANLLFTLPAVIQNKLKAVVVSGFMEQNVHLAVVMLPIPANTMRC